MAIFVTRVVDELGQLCQAVICDKVPSLPHGVIIGGRESGVADGSALGVRDGSWGTGSVPCKSA